MKRITGCLSSRRSAASLAALELPQRAARVLVGACRRRRRGETLQLATPFTRGDAFFGLRIVRARFRRGSAPQWDAEHDDLDACFIARDPDTIVDAHFARRFDALIVHMHETARNGSGGLRAALEKASAPKPFVDSKRLHSWRRRERLTRWCRQEGLRQSLKLGCIRF